MGVKEGVPFVRCENCMLCVCLRVCMRVRLSRLYARARGCGQGVHARASLLAHACVCVHVCVCVRGDAHKLRRACTPPEGVRCAVARAMCAYQCPGLGVRTRRGS